MRGRIRPARDGRGPRWSRLVPVLLLALLVVVPTAPGSADTSEPFRDGEWLGSHSAHIAFETPANGHTLTYDSHVDGTVGFVVEDGTAEGEWDLGGIGRFELTGQMTGEIDLVFEAEGELTGDRSALTLDGQTVTRGEGVMRSPEAGAIEMSIGPTQNPIGPMDVEIAEFRCNLLVGDWTTTIEVQTADQPVRPEVTADFVAAYQGETRDSDLFERFQQLREDGAAWEQEYRETGELDPAVLNDLVNRIYELEQERRAGFDECLFDSDADRDDFIRLLTLAAEGLGRLALEAHELPAANLEDLVDFLLYFGVVGDGAVDQESAAEIEDLIAGQVERIVAERVLTDGESPQGEPCSADSPCLGIDAEARNALRTAARLGLTVEVAGSEYTAQEILDTLDAHSSDGADQEGDA